MSKEVLAKTTIGDQGDLILRKKYPTMDDDTFYSFKLICQAKGLNPHCDQIYAVPRKNYTTGKTTWTFQTSIDGYRLIADRTGNYAPGREPSFSYDTDGKLISATSYLKKRTGDGTWHECAATAFFDEYAQTYKNKEGIEKLTEFWANMPHGQLAKCSESLNLRRSFPFETANLYTREEMQNTKMAQVLEDINNDDDGNLASVPSETVNETNGEIKKEEPKPSYNSSKTITEKQQKFFYAKTKAFPAFEPIVKKMYPLFPQISMTEFNKLLDHFEEWKLGSSKAVPSEKEEQAYFEDCPI